METKYEIKAVIQQLNRKLLLLHSEKKAVKREEIIDGILLKEEGELHQLKKLVGLIKE